MDRIIVENVRCFRDRQSIPLRPVTLLVGENSSGKTTFLSLARLAWDACQGRVPLDFNEEPFLLGAYDQIASYRRGRPGRARSFTIGMQVSIDPDLRQESAHELPDAISFTGQFVRQGAQPGIEEWVLEAGPYSVKTVYAERQGTPTIDVAVPSGRMVFLEVPLALWASPPVFISTLPVLPEKSITPQEVREKAPSRSDLDLLARLTRAFFGSLGNRPYAFAPIRTRPRRTYDPLRAEPQPEGSHVPMVLARMHASDPEGWERLRGSLAEFGRSSGLFGAVEVRRKGQKESDPFQVTVEIAGPHFNLLDVGYGVSQVLPIVVDALREPAGSTFLLQQPEVHLHPQAQAALGSFLALVAKEQRKRFLIETHSDHLVDRIRMDVRDRGYLDENDVSILYFEREGGSVQVHPLELDRFGNIVNAPPGYRQFFLEEEERLLLG